MSNINGYLDFEGLKTYHELAGYSEIPITGYTKDKYLNKDDGTEGSRLNARVTDYIKLPSDAKCTIASTPRANGDQNVICFYDKDGIYTTGEEFREYVTFKLSEKKSVGGDRVSTQFRLSAAVSVADTTTPLTIRSIHENVIDLLSDQVVENDTTIKNVIQR